MKSKNQCGAHARTTGYPCQAQAMPNGRCPLQGGFSRGAQTPEGKQTISAANKERMANGQLEKAKDGFQICLKNGGREHLSRQAKQRFARAKLIKAKT